MADSKTIEKYKDAMYNAISLLIPYVSREQMEDVLNYSVNKRFKNSAATVTNTYEKTIDNVDLLTIADYIASREPVICASGVIFTKYGDAPNPLADTIQSFLDKRTEYKNEMFKYPKGSFDWNSYNLRQSLEKINCNAVYGILGLGTSIVYDVNIATSVTSQGRSVVSTMSLFFEQFLANNVLFGSLDEVMEYIAHVVAERPERKFNDDVILNVIPTYGDCFAKVIMSCGYRWIPSEKEMEIIWQAINNLTHTDMVRLFYKNNLYQFMENEKPREIVKYILRNLQEPFLTSAKPPKNVVPALDELSDLMYEYVYSRYMWMDRIDRCDNMIKSVIMVSDTDSTIVSLDVWYKYILNMMGDETKNLEIARNIVDPLYTIEYDEFGDVTEETKKKYMSPIYTFDPEYDYDFYTDEIVEMKHVQNPLIELPQDNVRHSIINILAYVLDRLVNDYLERYCENNNSYRKGGPRKCRMMAKNEFTFRRLLMTEAKKSYASLQELQEGNEIPEDEQLDIKGIASMAKSSMAESTRDALKKILLEDIMKTPEIDQFRIIKKIAVLEKQITNSLYSGSKEFYKPVSIKAQNAYEMPMRIQGIKASIAWNGLRDPGDPAINLDERNALDLAKVKIDKRSIEEVKDKYPEFYERATVLLDQPEFKGGVDCIAIPLDAVVPEWLIDLLDYDAIVNDNVGGFVYESVGIKRFGKNSINYSNILQL